ncbi:MAG: FliH/SctL family protein [Roseburia sp.]|nr:FliH/SctL family protein [Roseburia sp.]MCM1096967.1 FliH/SctL family protein [Ruminococcus flavefaciens]
MSRNLLKQFSLVQSDETRVIDTNQLVEQRLEELREKEQGADFAELEASGEQVSGGQLLRAQEEARQTLAAAREEAEGVLAQARAQAEQILGEARDQGEAEKSTVRAEAQRQGYAEGLRQAQAEGQKLKREYQEKERQLEDFYQRQIDELEPRLTDAITAVYEHVFHVELQSYREVLSYLISSTLQKNHSGHEFMIHVSKEDYPYVSMTKKQILAEAALGSCNAEVVEDLTLAKNECLIETENGIFDCGLGTQLSELKRKIMLLSWSGEE